MYTDYAGNSPKYSFDINIVGAAFKFENGKLKIGLSAGIGFNLTMKLW